MRISRRISAIVSTPVLLGLLGCEAEEVKYQPRPAPTAQASLPAMPSVPGNPIKVGDAYTVWGASYYLRSRVHRAEIDGQEIKLTGYVIKTNLDQAPKCSIHDTGKADPDDCVAPVPTFWLADSADAPEEESIRVMGWASNFAQIYSAIKEYKNPARKSKTEPDPVTDEFWGVALPEPLPVKGAKVTVKGVFGNNFTRPSRSPAADPIMGLLTYNEIEYHETPEEVATLPGVR